MAAKKEKKTAQNEAKQEAQEPVVERNDLLEAQEALEAEKNKFLRLFAEFENYKKRTRMPIAPNQAFKSVWGELQRKVFFI